MLFIGVDCYCWDWARALTFKANIWCKPKKGIAITSAAVEALDKPVACPRYKRPSDADFFVLHTSLCCSVSGTLVLYICTLSLT